MDNSKRPFEIRKGTTIEIKWGRNLDRISFQVLVQQLQMNIWERGLLNKLKIELRCFFEKVSCPFKTCFAHFSQTCLLKLINNFLHILKGNKNLGDSADKANSTKWKNNKYTSNLSLMICTYPLLYFWNNDDSVVKKLEHIRHSF